MNTILYRIPDKYFPGVKIKAPFHAKVNYTVNGWAVTIEDVCFSAKCMKYLQNNDKLIEQMKNDIQEVERGKVGNGHVDATIIKAIGPWL